MEIGELFCVGVCGSVLLLFGVLAILIMLTFNVGVMRVLQALLSTIVTEEQAKNLVVVLVIVVVVIGIIFFVGIITTVFS